jgi:hypothetical protein
MCLNRARRLRAMQVQTSARIAAESRYGYTSDAKKPHVVDNSSEPFSFPAFAFGHENTLPVRAFPVLGLEAS